MSKYIICDVREGALISQGTPYIPGIDWSDWEEIPESRINIGKYYQCDLIAKIPREVGVENDDLPLHCSVVEMTEEEYQSMMEE